MVYDRDNDRPRQATRRARAKCVGCGLGQVYWQNFERRSSNGLDRISVIHLGKECFLTPTSRTLRAARMQQTCHTVSAPGSGAAEWRSAPRPGCPPHGVPGIGCGTHAITPAEQKRCERFTCCHGSRSLVQRGAACISDFGFQKRFRSEAARHEVVQQVP